MSGLRSLFSQDPEIRQTSLFPEFPTSAIPTACARFAIPSPPEANCPSPVRTDDRWPHKLRERAGRFPRDSVCTPHLQFVLPY